MSLDDWVPTKWWANEQKEGEDETQQPVIQGDVDDVDEAHIFFWKWSNSPENQRGK